MKTYAYIAQTPQIQPPQNPADLTVWAILGGVFLLLSKEAIAIFRQQNNQESKMIERFLERQQEREDRMDQRHDELLKAINAIVVKTHDNTVRLEAGVNELSRLHYHSTRSTAENLMGIRSELQKQNAVMTELLRRSDAIWRGDTNRLPIPANGKPQG